MGDKASISHTIDVAGAGFRLSLVLNAVGTQVGDAGSEIQKIAKEISLFSLILKQVALNLGTPESVASQRALDAAQEITSQSETVFNEVKEMVQMSQKRDSDGHIRFISIAQEVKWVFKKQRVQYLLGQLESLKLSLSLMLQILQLGRMIATSRRDPSKPLPKEQDMRQERAEIQNIVVVRHWSLVDLQRLYELAEKEAAQPTQSPPQSLQEAVELPAGDPRLSIAGPEHDDDLSKAPPRSIELSLSRLDASMKKAVNRPEVLHSPGDDVVDVLLDEWTQLRELGSQSRHHHHKSHRYKTSYHTDDDDELEPEFDRAKGVGGQYIQGPPNGNKRKVKSVHFRARVESDTEGSDKVKQQPKKPPSRHVLRSEASFSSLTSSSASSDS
ncbi:hypothetical protein MMC31_002744, partial [Peltigera leucophlebia]|nr:hypothetical protein [Peltigera leucophlebia]